MTTEHSSSCPVQKLVDDSTSIAQSAAVGEALIRWVLPSRALVGAFIDYLNADAENQPVHWGDVGFEDIAEDMERAADNLAEVSERSLEAARTLAAHHNGAVPRSTSGFSSWGTLLSPENEG